MYRTIAMISLIGLSTGCGVSQSKFGAKYAAAVCGWAEECEMLDYMGGDVDTCTESYTEIYDALVSSDVCPDYNGKEAKACIKEIKDAECEGTTTDSDSACTRICGDGSSDTGA